MTAETGAFINAMKGEIYRPWMPFTDGVSDADRKEVVRSLTEVGEHYAAGFLAESDAPVYRRCAAALLRHAEHVELMPWEGTHLYPWTAERYGVGPVSRPGELWGTSHPDPLKNSALRYRHSYAIALDHATLEHKLRAYGEDTHQGRALKLVKDLYDRCFSPPGGYTHCTPNHGRVMIEGLHGYRQRIRRKLTEGGDESQRVLWQALDTVIEAATVFQRRFVERIQAGEGDVDHRITLVHALEKVPFEPASTFYEAMLTLNFLYYLDGCDSPGRVDQYLWPYYRRDREAGLIDDEFVLELLREFWRNLDCTEGWNVAIGGTHGADGRSAVNNLTYLVLESAKGSRRPNLALRIPADADDRLWDKAFDSISTGTGLPALYNDSEYVAALREYNLGVTEEDLRDVSFGGCTETMIQGCSNVGSLAGQVHLLAVLERTLNASLDRTASFEAFLAIYKEQLAAEVAEVCRYVNRCSETRARYTPHLVRTLLVDDCIDRGREFYAGGARYNWEILCLEGFANVVDSLVTLKELTFGRGEIPPEKMIAALKADYKGCQRELTLIHRLHKYGQGNASVDALARDIAEFVFAEFAKHRAWRGDGRFLASCLMFNTYAERGKFVGATPDGRRAHAPLADSFGAHQGRDTRGPTALLNSVTTFPHRRAPGTLVVNIRLAPDMVRDPRLRRKTQALLKTYFARGGMQIQVFVQDQAVLLDALEHPERHENLIIRIGGFSMHFNELSPDLKRELIARTVHA